MGLSGTRSRLAMLAICMVGAASACPAAAAGSPDLSIRVLSDRSDVISGGDALVAVQVPESVQPSQITMTLNGRDVTGQFAKRANGRYEGRLEGLKIGRNVLTASAPAVGGDSAVLRNHSTGGPLFSGPQARPWVCPDCSSPPKCQE